MKLLIYFSILTVRVMVGFDILVYISKDHLLPSYQITHSDENTKNEPKARKFAKRLSIPSKIGISGLFRKLLSSLKV